jgi:hypothetical protein
MIGLLQSGTGIGRGICLPIVSRGLFEACAVAPGREPDLRTTPWEPRWEKPSVVAPYGATFAIEWLLGCRRCRFPRAEWRACERCPPAEGGCGWRCVPPDVCSTAVTLRGDEGAAAEPGTGVVPELPEVLTVGADGPLESAEGPPAEDAEGGLPAADSEGLPEDAGGLLVGGVETLPVEVPGSDTLTSGAPEDVSGKDTLIEGVPDGDVPSRDTLTEGALGADPSGSDTLITEVCSSDTLTGGAPGEDAVEELDESGTWALAYPAVSSATHRRPARSPTAPAPTHRGRGLAVRLRLR